MHKELKDILKPFDYKCVPSRCVPNDTGLIIAIKNYYFSYYDEDKYEIDLSIALSVESDRFNPKCWLSLKDGNIDDPNKPKCYPPYVEFLYEEVRYYPYSVATSMYPLSKILDLCDGLYKFVLEERGTKND